MKGKVWHGEMKHEAGSLVQNGAIQFENDHNVTIMMCHSYQPSSQKETGHLGVSKNNGTPKWMVYKGKPYEQMDDLGGPSPIFGNTHKKKPLGI